MSSGREPTASEVLDLMLRLEQDQERRGTLWRGYDIFSAAVAEEILGEDSIDWLAQRMQDLYEDGLIAHGPVSGGVREPPVWDGNWIQSANAWRTTGPGWVAAAGHRREGPPVDDLSVGTIRERKVARLREAMNAGMRLREQGSAVAPDELRRHVVNWSENLGVTIRALTDEYQEGLFLAVASDELDPRAALLAKVQYVEDELLPKLRGGQFDVWSSSLD
jgi:hypothetical protein